MEKKAQSELKRGIKSWQVTLIGTGAVVGSCYFLGLGALIRDMGPAVILAYIIVALIVYGMMLSYSELLVNLPSEGSFITYTKVFLGQTISVGIGWAFWFNWVCYIPSEVIAISVIINSFFPGNQMAYAIGALVLLTIINLSGVDVFAKVESVFAIMKICAISVFCLLAFGVWIGLWGNEGFLGAQVNFGGSLLTDWFPNGIGLVLTNMVVVLVNFQGIEILGLAAAETQNAETAVPKACRAATYLIMAMYLCPIVMILAIFPAKNATLDGAIFTQVLSYYGLDFWAAIISAVILFATFSCANTGLYGAVRCMYGLASEKLAPSCFEKLNKRGSPLNAVLFTLVCMWVVLMWGLTNGGSALYESLLSVSGFTGAMAWIGIIICQFRFRAKLKKAGYTAETCLKAAVPKKQRWITMFALIAQIVFLIMLGFGEGQLFVFLIACLAIMLPMVTNVLFRQRSKRFVGLMAILTMLSFATGELVVLIVACLAVLLPEVLHMQKHSGEVFSEGTAATVFEKNFPST